MRFTAWTAATWHRMRCRSQVLTQHLPLHLLKKQIYILGKKTRQKKASHIIRSLTNGWVFDFGKCKKPNFPFMLSLPPPSDWELLFIFKPSCFWDISVCACIPPLPFPVRYDSSSIFKKVSRAGQGFDASYCMFLFLCWSVEAQSFWTGFRQPLTLERNARVQMQHSTTGASSEVQRFPEWWLCATPHQKSVQKKM